MSVIIVGAGPTGLSLAHELIRQGVPFRIVDMVTKRGTNEHRAAGIHARSLDVFHRYGARAEMIARGTSAFAFSMYSRGRRLFQVEWAGRDQNSSMLVLPQSHIEEILIDRLHGLGKAVERPVELVALESEDDGVRVSLRHPDGHVEHTTARFVVGCDGGRSTVRQLLGVEFPGKKFQPAIVADARVTNSGTVSPGVAITSLGAKTMLNIGEIQPGITRIVAVLHDDDPRAKSLEPSKELIQSLLDEHAEHGYHLREIVWSSTFRVTNRMVSKLRHDRVFLIGDAAHIHTPFAGQGLNTGVQDAANLGWKLSLVVRGIADEKLLDSVDQERLPRIRSVLWTTETLQRVYMIKNPVMRLMRDVGFVVMGKLSPLMTFARRWSEQHTVTYASAAVSGDARAGRPKAGAYADDVAGLQTVAADSTTLLDLLASDPRSHLLIFGAVDEARALARLVEGRYPDVIKPWVVSASLPTDSNDLSDPLNAFQRHWRNVKGLILVRPDGFVGFRSGVLDIDKLTDHVAGRLGIKRRSDG